MFTVLDPQAIDGNDLVTFGTSTPADTLLWCEAAAHAMENAVVHSHKVTQSHNHTIAVGLEMLDTVPVGGHPRQQCCH